MIVFDESIIGHKARAINLWLAIDKYAREHDKPIDWDKDNYDGLNPKWTIEYLHGKQYVEVGPYTEMIKPSEKLIAVPTYSMQGLGTIYFNSKEVCKEVIRRFNSSLVWYFTKYWKEELNERTKMYDKRN